jgi:hypothetical protein
MAFVFPTRDAYCFLSLSLAHRHEAKINSLLISIQSRSTKVSRSQSMDERNSNRYFWLDDRAASTQLPNASRYRGVSEVAGTTSGSEGPDDWLRPQNSPLFGWLEQSSETWNPWLQTVAQGHRRLEKIPLTLAAVGIVLEGVGNQADILARRIAKR